MFLLLHWWNNIVKKIFPSPPTALARIPPVVKILISIIIIIIKKGRQSKAERDWYTPYQSEDPSPTIPTYWQKEEKGKKRRRL